MKEMIEQEPLKQLDKFIRKNPHVSLTALCRIGDVIHNLPEEVEISKVFPLDNGGVYTFIDTKSKSVCLHSDKNGNMSVLDSNENGKPEPRTWFNNTVPVEVVCSEVIR